MRLNIWNSNNVASLWLKVGGVMGSVEKKRMSCKWEIKRYMFALVRDQQIEMH